MDISKGKRYIEVVGDLGAWHYDGPISGDPVAGYTFYTGYSSPPSYCGSTRKDIITGCMCRTGPDGRETVNIGDFTRENIEKLLYIRGTPETLPFEDFHAVCDDMEIPWATKDGFDKYQRIMRLADARDMTK